MIREHFPQQRQQCFVGDNALPCRFQPANASVFQLGGEHFTQHKLPRIQLEQVGDHLVLHVRELTFFTEPDIFDIEKFSGNFSLSRAILQILDRSTIFDCIATAGQVQQLKTVLLAQFSETFDQFFLQAVELITAFRQVARIKLIFQPDPLEKSSFIQ